MQTLIGLFYKIPYEWRIRALKWGIPFVLGWIVRLIWGFDGLFLGLFLLAFLDFLFGRRAFEHWLLDRVWNLMRNFLIAAMIPDLFYMFRDIWRAASGQPVSEWLISMIVGLLVAVILIAAVFNAFAQAPRTFSPARAPRRRTRTTSGRSIHRSRSRRR